MRVIDDKKIDKIPNGFDWNNAIVEIVITNFFVKIVFANIVAFTTLSFAYNFDNLDVRYQ